MSSGLLATGSLPVTIPAAAASPVLGSGDDYDRDEAANPHASTQQCEEHARRTLERPAQVAFFRALGRSYAVVGNMALVLALACGAALLRGHHWDATTLAAVVLAGVLVVATVAGMTQARGMTRLRQRAIREPADPVLTAQVRRGAVRATVIRATIGALSLALLALVAALVT